MRGMYAEPDNEWLRRNGPTLTPVYANAEEHTLAEVSPTR